MCRRAIRRYGAPVSPLLLALALSTDAAAGPWHGTLGVDWVPFGRADLAWIEEDQLSGTLVSATDGMLSPPLTLEGGVASATDAVVLGLGLARVGTTTANFDSEGALTSRSGEHVLGLRLGADYRRWLVPRVTPGSGEDAHVSPFVQAGGYGVIPSAQKYDDTWTEEEQSAQDEDAGAERARIGAVGLRAGGGADLCWTQGLCLGLRGLVVVHRAQAVGEGFRTVSTLVSLEPALSLDLGF